VLLQFPKEEFRIFKCLEIYPLEEKEEEQEEEHEKEEQEEFYF